jgi:hypothetical protein
VRQRTGPFLCDDRALLFPVPAQKFYSIRDAPLPAGDFLVRVQLHDSYRGDPTVGDNREKNKEKNKTRNKAHQERNKSITSPRS